MASLCDIYDARVNGCGVHDGLMQYDVIFEIFLRISFLVDIFTQRKLHYGHKR